MFKKYNIGIMGAGNIAGVMAHTVKKMKGVKLYAVASRQQVKADVFANKYGCKKAYGSYEELVMDKKVDLIPLFFAEIEDSKEEPVIKRFPDYFVWSTNPNHHKNHKFALAALEKYYGAGGKYECVITGANTDWFDPRTKEASPYPYVNEIRDIFLLKWK